MHVRNGAFGIAAVAIGVLASGSSALAQWAEETPVAIDVLSNSSKPPESAVPTLGRHAALSSQVAALSAVPPARPPAASDNAPQSSLLQHLFVSGIADLVRGNPAEAADVFEATASTTDEVPQLTYLSVLAQILSDFDHRDQALPLAKRALARDPDHALYRLIAILADRDLSSLQPDGALYFTPAGAKQLHAAIASLPAQTDAYNRTYLAAFLARDAETGNPALPERLAGFAAMLGEGRSLRLAGIDSPQALGRLFVLTIPPAVLARGEARLLAGLRDGSEPPSADVTMIADRASVLVP